MPEELKEKVLVFDEKTPKSYKDKQFWECVTGEGGRFTCWDKSLADAIIIGSETKVKYEVKKSEKYTNYTIKAVAIQKEDGSWGEWLEAARSKGGGKPFDSDAANKRTCLQAAATIVAAQMAKGNVSNPVATILKTTSDLMNGVFAKGATAAAPAETKVTKKAQVVEAEEVETEEVPF